MSDLKCRLLERNTARVRAPPTDPQSLCTELSSYLGIEKARESLIWALKLGKRSRKEIKTEKVSRNSMAERKKYF